MKKLIIALTLFLAFSNSSNAQAHLNQNGTPDMRYKENKQQYGNTYSTPNSTYSTPTYSTPTYTNPSTGNPSSYPSYPTKQNGTPDMRYKENKQIYGSPKL